MEISLKQDKRGNWVSSRVLGFKTSRNPIDVEVFGKELKNFLEAQGLPFPYKRIYLRTLFLETGHDLIPRYQLGKLIIVMKNKSWYSYLNPFHNVIHSDKTITISYWRSHKTISFYQEYKSKDLDSFYTWKIPLKQIRAFRELVGVFLKKDNLGKILYSVE